MIVTQNLKILFINELVYMLDVL